MRIMDVAAFQRLYGPWLESAKPPMLEGRWKEAFKEYPLVHNDDVPWAPLAKPLDQCKLGLFTTAGLYIEGEQESFDSSNIEGDWSTRILPVDVDPQRLRIAHDHFDHTVAEADHNSVFPVDRLRELVGEGILGAIHGETVSISGYNPRADRIAEETAPAVVRVFQEAGVDAVLFVPV